MSIFKGSGVALVTPMKENGEINYDSLERLIEDQIKNGTDALVVVGTSGEAPTLDDPEHLEAIRFSAEVTKGRIPVVAGTGSNNTAHAVMMSEEAEKLGADGLLLVTPYYNKATQDGLYQHYRTIASATKLPLPHDRVSDKAPLHRLQRSFQDGNQYPARDHGQTCQGPAQHRSNQGSDRQYQPGGQTGQPR